MGSWETRDLTRIDLELIEVRHKHMTETESMLMKYEACGSP